MSKLTFYIVDVFAQGKYTGNQLAVITNAGSLSTQQMQQIAKEINYSETTFILDNKINQGSYDVRIFTPEQELPFAGHPTLGTAYIIHQEISQEPVDIINLNLPIGQIPVTAQKGEDGELIWWMQQQSPTFMQPFTPESLSEVLNLDNSAIDLKFPIQEVSTGVPFIIVPLKNQEYLKQIKLNRESYFELIAHTQAKAILVFCPQTYAEENDLSVRVFADYLGIPEDPATGSANGCLAGYLARYNYFSHQDIDVRVEQGYEIGRPSLLLLKAQKREEISVHVGGKVVMVAKGELV